VVIGGVDLMADIARVISTGGQDWRSEGP